MKMITYLKKATLFGLMVTGFVANAQTGSWTKVKSLSPIKGGALMYVLTDGSIMCRSTESVNGLAQGNRWMKLVPDNKGSYENGTWVTLASANKDRLYYSGQVLTDGRLYLAGGEYGSGGRDAEIYNPKLNTWTSTADPTGHISDASSYILPDGRILQSYIGETENTKIYDPKNNTYKALTKSKLWQAEVSFLKLPDNSIIFVGTNTKTSERFFPETETWVMDAPLPVELYSKAGSETGDAFMLPNGKAIFFGGNGKSAIYTPSGTSAMGSWEAGPEIPNLQSQPDAPGCMMVNGRILLAVSPQPVTGNVFQNPTSFYEYNYVTNTYTRVVGPSGNLTENYPNYVTGMVQLPDGNVMFSQMGQTQFHIYKPGGSTISVAKPAITSIYPNACNGASYTITGLKFNGIAEGAYYGNDFQMNSNYPIIRLTDISGNLYYARTTLWQPNAPQGNTKDTAQFELPQNLPSGNYQLVVTVNGVASDPISFKASTCTTPLVKITSPLNKAVFGNVPATVLINATATIGTGTISKVEFYSGKTLLGTSTNSPYTFNWSNVAVGNYSITAKAYSALGDTARSMNVNITVGNQNPLVQITSPTYDDTFVQPGPVTINANASDPDGTVSKIEFYYGSTLIGSDNSAPYSITWNNVLAGTYNLTAKAYDNVNAIGVSEITRVQIVKPSPTVVLTSPANGNVFISPATITLSALANDQDANIAKVEFYNGNTLIGTDNTSPFTYSWTNVVAGTYAIMAKAYDTDNLTASSDFASITVYNNCDAPAWVSTKAYVGGDIVSYNGNKYKASYWTQNNIPTGGGAWVKISDCSANTSPTISITSPVNNTLYTNVPATVNISASASDANGTVSSVSFYANTTLLGSDAIAPYTFTWNNVLNGIYELTAVATDNTGITLNSNIITIKVQDGTLTSIDNQDNNTVGLYPNPTEGLVNLNKIVDKITVTDIFGTEILNLSNVNSIDLSHQSAGIYVFKIQINGKMDIVRVMKK